MVIQLSSMLVPVSFSYVNSYSTQVHSINPSCCVSTLRIVQERDKKAVITALLEDQSCKSNTN